MEMAARQTITPETYPKIIQATLGHTYNLDNMMDVSIISYFPDQPTVSRLIIQQYQQTANENSYDINRFGRTEFRDTVISDMTPSTKLMYSYEVVDDKVMVAKFLEMESDVLSGPLIVGKDITLTLVGEPGGNATLMIRSDNPAKILYTTNGSAFDLQINTPLRLGRSMIANMSFRNNEGAATSYPESDTYDIYNNESFLGFNGYDKELCCGSPALDTMDASNISSETIVSETMVSKTHNTKEDMMIPSRFALYNNMKNCNKDPYAWGDYAQQEDPVLAKLNALPISGQANNVNQDIKEHHGGRGGGSGGGRMIGGGQHSGLMHWGGGAGSGYGAKTYGRQWQGLRTRNSQGPSFDSGDSWLYGAPYTYPVDLPSYCGPEGYPIGSVYPICGPGDMPVDGCCI